MHIRVGRYSKESVDGVPGVGVHWQGWIEPSDKSWIAFIKVDGTPVFFLNRDPKTGAVLPDDPVEAKAKLKRIRSAKA